MFDFEYRHIIYFLLIFYSFSSFLPLYTGGQWWLRAFDFPRIPLAIIGVISLSAHIILNQNSNYFEYLTIICGVALLTSREF